jgi:hypothetical protein
LRPEDERPEPPSFLKRVVSRFSGKQTLPLDQEVRRLEEKRLALSKATDQWLSLLREMEQQGQSGEVAYERYYEAYLAAKKQQKHVELTLFNLRNQRAS